jgi:hypothetical protein
VYSILQLLREKIAGFLDWVLWRRQPGGRSGSRRAPKAPSGDKPITKAPTPPAGAGSSWMDAPTSRVGKPSTGLRAQDLHADAPPALTENGAPPTSATETSGQGKEPRLGRTTTDPPAHAVVGQSVLPDRQIVVAALAEAASERMLTVGPEPSSAAIETVLGDPREAPSQNLSDANEGESGSVAVAMAPAAKEGQHTAGTLAIASLMLPRGGTYLSAESIELRAEDGSAESESALRGHTASAAQVELDSVAGSARYSGDELSTCVEAITESEESAHGLTGENTLGPSTDVTLSERSIRSDASVAQTSKGIHAGAFEGEPERPPVVSAPPLDETDYLLWNRALARHCLLGEGGEEEAFLTITPTILAAALAAVQPGRQLPEDAESSFVDAVAQVYHSRVLGRRHKLAVLGRCGADGLPDCIAFLAGSVLAAYRMQTDEEAAATAYYLRLSEILKCEVVAGRPRGFDPDEFEALWRFLDRWLREEKGRRLAMPGPAVGLRRFIALPLTHVPLRRVDIERLPDFFAWSGYGPGARIQRQKLEQDLSRWSLGRFVFTNAGMAALADERRTSVIAQIAHELESWDGSHTDSLGRRSARVEILLDIVQRRPELSYLPRRPAAFPAVFDHGVHTFEASDEGWYNPLPLRPEDGRDLAEGFAWEVASGPLRLTLRRPGASVIAMPASHEYTGFLSQRALKSGAPGAVLCREALAIAAAEYLSAISQRRCTPFNHPSVPDGWRLFTGIRPLLRIDALPSGLESLAVESAVDLIPVGGLRLGGRWAWVAGAPPLLIAAGLLPGDRVTIDGEPVSVADDGVLAADGRLASPGTHIVEVGEMSRRIEIVEPEVRNAFLPFRLGTAVAVPPGRWVLVGSTPGELAYPVCRSRGGVVAFCVFTPAWAIAAGAGPGATVLWLDAKRRSPGRVERFSPHGLAGRNLGVWASTIYNAAVRRPRLISLYGDEPGVEIRNAWAAFSRSARDIKRRFRKARR